MALDPADLIEIKSVESPGLFFRRLGELCFHEASQQYYKGTAASVAVAGRSGVVLFSDCQGEEAMQE